MKVAGWLVSRSYLLQDDLRALLYCEERPFCWLLLALVSLIKQVRIKQNEGLIII